MKIKKKGHHARRCSIFRPKTSEEQRKSHHALRLSFIRISPLLAFVCAPPGTPLLILAVVYDIKHDSSNNSTRQRLGLHYPTYDPTIRKVAQCPPLVYVVTSTQSLNIQNSEECGPSVRDGEKVTATIGLRVVTIYPCQNMAVITNT